MVRRDETLAPVDGCLIHIKTVIGTHVFQRAHDTNGQSPRAASDIQDDTVSRQPAPLHERACVSLSGDEKGFIVEKVCAAETQVFSGKNLPTMEDTFWLEESPDTSFEGSQCYHTMPSMDGISSFHKPILPVVKRVYFERLPGVPVIPLLLPNLKEDLPTRQLFQKEAFRDLTDPLVEIVEDPARADVHLLPHNYPLVAGNADYLRRCQETAARHGKKIVVFWNGDGTGPVALENAVVFRTSQYESKLRQNEHIMPAYAEDLKGKGLFVRDKTDTSPVIGFCGWAQYKNTKNAIGSFVQALPHEAYALLTGYPQSRSFIKGLWLRRQALKSLSQSKSIRTNFLLRSSHSAHAKTIRMDPLQARREYIENMLASDFVLSIRGDGNYSLRFYEALSLGRVPILLNTDVCLPLAGIVEYSSFILQIHIADMYRIDEIVADFWEHQTDQSWFVMQLRARDAFEKYLSAPRFLAYAVEHLF